MLDFEGGFSTGVDCVGAVVLGGDWADVCPLMARR